MWDLLIITAGDEDQVKEFKHQLDSLDISKYVNKVEVIPDPVDLGRIGSGGSMISLAGGLLKNCTKATECDKRVLLMHSGGYAQRMAYQSLYGKCFAWLPGPITFLELKLREYQQLSKNLPSGLCVTSSDVIEDVTKANDLKFTDDVDMILFATECDLETATQHGVFVMNAKDELLTVLQKPSREKIINICGVLTNGNALTDSFYWMSWKKVEQLGRLKDQHPISQEICCYGDFMQALGKYPKISYLNEGSANLQQWRKDLYQIFADSTTTVIKLGQDSFFHLGTHSEITEHISAGSIFSQKFLKFKNKPIFSNFENVPPSSLVEFCNKSRNCNQEDIKIGNNVIASMLSTDTALTIPNNVMIFTVPLLDGKFVTCLISRDQDVKIVEKNLQWMGINCGMESNLWKANIFPVEDTREDSLLSLLRQLELGKLDKTKELISIDDAVFDRANMKAALLYRDAKRREFAIMEQ